MKKNIIKITAFILCLSLMFMLCACDVTKNGITFTEPNFGEWEVLPEESPEETLSEDNKPNINITEIGPGTGAEVAPDKDEIVDNIIGDDATVYDVIYENVSFTLHRAGFNTANAAAINFDDDEGETSIGIMYYFDDFNLFANDKTRSAGFYEIVGEKEYSVHFEDVDNLYIKDLNSTDDTEYLGAFDYTEIGYDHFVYKNQYVIYYQESNNTIRYETKENIKDNYDLTLGSLYDYDNQKYIYDESIFGEYKNHSAVELFEKEDYEKLEGELKDISDAQNAAGYEVSEFNIIYISPESIQAYIASEETDTFFGYKVEDLTKALGKGSVLKYTDNGFEDATIYEETDPNFDWKSFLIKIGIGCGVVLVGAILTPLTGGASFGCALVTISKVALSFALVSSLEQLTMNTVKGLIDGKDFKAAIKDGAFSGLDAFANGFMIGAAIGSVGTVTGLIKPSACFVSGTPIKTLDGYKDIEDICVGDVVLSYNNTTRVNEYNVVTDTFEKKVNNIIELQIGEKIIKTTPNHPFYVPYYNTWMAAENLQVGEHLLNYEGDIEQVSSIHRLMYDEQVSVYNFTVQNNHNYYVGDSGILVHNKCDNVITKQECQNARNKAGKTLKKDALDDIINNRNIESYGFDLRNKDDLEVIRFIQKNKRYPSLKTDGLQCDFAHAADVNNIVDAFNNGLITKQQALEFMSNSNNGILCSHGRHITILHGGDPHNPTNYQIAINARPSIEPTVMRIFKELGYIVS